MEDRLSSGDRTLLAQLITRSLGLTDEIGATMVGISLNNALLALTGEGVPPRA